MRLIKQTILYFREGSSDKVYEVDLCDVGSDKFVVNFRYGRRGTVLKEASKTPVPVVLNEAEKIYNTVIDEKLSKGYTTSESGISAVPRAAAFQLAVEVPPSTSWQTSLPTGRNRAILQRLQDAAEGNHFRARSSWKLSRVIWRAGEYKIKEAVPYIIHLFNKGDVLHQYSCTYAIARGHHEASVEALRSIFATHPTPAVRKIAGAGLIQVLTGLPKDQHLQHYFKALPEAMQEAIDKNDPRAFDELLFDRMGQLQASLPWIENLYLYSLDKKWLRTSAKSLLQSMDMKPPQFKHFRAVYKLAALLDDFEISGILACRIERETEMFQHYVTQDDLKTTIDIDGLDEEVNPHKELKKPNSRLAYSNKTRWYLHRRIRRRLRTLGNTNNTDYVRLATAILVSYNHNSDFKKAYSEFEHNWIGNKRTEIRFPQNAHAILLHEILSAYHPDLKLINGKIWQLRAAKEARAKPPVPARNQNSGGIIKKLLNLFGGKKKQASAVPAGIPRVPEEVSPMNENGTPFLHLWNKLPQSFIQLLLEASMEEVHEFAEGALKVHPEFTAIKDRLDKQVCKQLLRSPYEVPAAFGYQIVLEKYSNKMPDGDLVAAMLNSVNEGARNTGKQWTETYASTLFAQIDFVNELLFAEHADIRTWAEQLIAKQVTSDDMKLAITGKAIATIMGIEVFDAVAEVRIKGATESLFTLFPAALKGISLPVIADLIAHRYSTVLLFGLRLLKYNKEVISPDAISRSFLFGLLNHPYEAVREVGLTFLEDIPEETLVQSEEEIIACCMSAYSNVRRGMASAITRLAGKERSFGYKAAEALMPLLIRRETSEGLHDDVSFLICTVLKDYLGDVNKETAFNLLYGNYTAAQYVGIVILENYTAPDQLTIPQVVALGGHENLQVRQWSWTFYTEQAARIKYEKEAAVKLLESKWQDTRLFAIPFFRDQFTATDWSAEALITLADSVKPEVEALGRELITRFFESEQGIDYLLKLSQHPSEKMQLFATNYLERFAADDVDKLESLLFYFRSVLTRVNKSRIAKNRIYLFLLTEGRKSAEAAVVVSNLLSHVSAIAAIGDKARCIDILMQLKTLYEVQTPLLFKPVETRG